MNFVSVQTSGLVDAQVGGSSYDCGGANQKCLRLHNGSTLFYNAGIIHFDALNPTDAIWFGFDPDNSYSGTTADNPGKSVILFVYVNGRVVNWDNVHRIPEVGDLERAISLVKGTTLPG